MKAEISVLRSSGSEDQVITIEVRVGMGKTIKVDMTPENLALALTGKSLIPAELRLRNVEIVTK